MQVHRFLVLAVGVLLALPLGLHAAPGDDSSFVEAGDAYRRGDYDRAEALWQAVLAGNLATADRARVCYDLGNLEWRRGRPHRAIGWYTAALRLDPRHEDARANRDFARRGVGLEPADRGDLRSTVDRVLTRWHPPEQRLLVLGGTLLLAVVLVFEMRYGGRRWLYLALGAVGLLVLLSLPWLASFGRSDPDPMLVIRSSSVSLRSEPNLERASIASAEPGEVVQRIDELPDWVRVVTADGEKGWVQAKTVFALDR